jgi:uncharacterized protein (TIGR02145 family)
MNIIKALLIVSTAVTVCLALDISGTVTDTGGTPLEGAAVWLEELGVSDKTGADGKFALIDTTTGIIGQTIHPPHKISVKVNEGVLLITAAERAPVKIITYNLQGKLLFTFQKSMDIGRYSVALPDFGAGVYVYKVRSGRSEFVLRSCSIDKVSACTIVPVHGSQSIALSRHMMSSDTINDIIAATMEGYLNYRVIVTNSDTSGIEIKMIVCAGTITDYDGHEYQTVRIGNQVWMTENLKTTRYDDGTISGYFFYDNDSVANAVKYGALYNWHAMASGKLAPTGWHVPDTTEWNILVNYLVLNGYNWDGTTDTTVQDKIGKSLAAKTDWNYKIGKSLAAKTDWNYSRIEGNVGNDLSSNNSSGFSALPGGYRFSSGSFNHIGYYGFWWSVVPNAHRRYLGFRHDNIGSLSGDNDEYGLSVRCVKD